MSYVNLQKCPSCGSQCYNRVREGNIKECYENGEMIAKDDTMTMWGYICRKCSTQWHYDNRKPVIGWEFIDQEPEGGD